MGDIALRICSDALPDIRQHLRGTPDSLSAFFNKAFQRNPDNRFQDVREFIAALGPAMGCEESLSNSGVRLGALGSAPQQSPPSSANPTRVSGPGRVDDSMDAIAPGTNVSVAETSWLSESGELTPPSSTVAGTLMTTGNQGARSQPQARVVALLGALAICLIGSVVVLTQGSSDVPAPATAKPGSDVVETSSSAAPDEANRTTPVASASAEPKPAKEEKETKPTKQRTLEQPRAKTKQSTVRKPARRRTTPRRQLPKQPSPAPQKRDKSKVRWF